MKSKKSRSVITSPWTNGSQNHKTGSGFGVKIPKGAMDMFQPKWTRVSIELGETEVDVPITPSFWRKCHELRSKDIGVWLIDNGLNKWPSRMPPDIELTHLGGNRFRLSVP